MFSATCDQCGRRQLFGYRRLAAFENEAPGVIALTWHCRSCDSFSVSRVGSAVGASSAVLSPS